MSKNVHFQTEAAMYVSYSSIEYDRSHSQPVPSHSTVYATTLPQRSAVNIAQTRKTTLSRPFIKPLDLSLIPNSSRRALNSSLSGANEQPFLSEGHDQLQQEQDGFDDFSMVVMAF